jgi:hypothetical protein
MMNKMFSLLLVVVTILVVQPQQASACNCALPDNAVSAMEQASRVIQGKVISLREVKLSGNEMMNVALIEVAKSWKGNVDSQVKIYTSWTSCQFDFVVGEEYLLYPYENEGRLEVINCSRSAEISQAKQDLLELGDGSEPTNIVNYEANKSTSFTGWMYVGLAIIAGILLLILKPIKIK